MASVLDSIRDPAVRHGLNLMAAVPVARYAAAVPDGESVVRARSARARSIIVIGNGGGAFWRALVAHAERDQRWWRREHPLDDFTREIVERTLVPACTQGGIGCVAAYPFMRDEPALDFMTLGRLAGLGGPSILGVLVHPVYGPWIAFRAALLVEADLDEPGDAAGFAPCPQCAVRSCVAACPAGAVAFPAGWNVPQCLRYRVEAEADCVQRCHARVGCVLGPEHRYPDDEMAYHQRQALAAMRPWYEANLARSPSGRGAGESSPSQAGKKSRF